MAKILSHVGWVRSNLGVLKSTNPYNLVDPPETPVAGAKYVSQDTGSDSTGDGTAGNPWATIQYGINQLVAGDTLYVRESVTYYRELGRHEFSDVGGIIVLPSGTANSRITIAGYPGERPIIDQGRLQSTTDVLTYQPSVITPVDCAGFYIRGDYITIKNFEIRQCEQSGISVAQTEGATSRNIIERCHIHHCYGWNNIAGIRLDDCRKPEARYNIIHDIYNDQVYADPQPEPLAYTNEGLPGHQAIQAYREGGALIEYNTCYHCDRGVFEKEAIAPGTIFDSEELQGPIVRFNLFYEMTNYALHSEMIGSNDEPHFNVRFYGNIVDTMKGAYMSELGETFDQSSGVHVYNNTILNTEFGIGSIRAFEDINVYNNIVHNSSVINFRTVDPVVGAFTNSNGVTYFNNNYYSSSVSQWDLEVFGGSQQSLTSLASWQGTTVAGLITTPDLDSSEGTVTFGNIVAAAGSRDYTQQAGSPALSVLRQDATTGEIGAYGLGETQIGSNWSL